MRTPITDPNEDQPQLAMRRDPSPIRNVAHPIAGQATTMQSDWRATLEALKHRIAEDDETWAHVRTHLEEVRGELTVRTDLLEQLENEARRIQQPSLTATIPLGALRL
jgi:hypothetical protein